MFSLRFLLLLPCFESPGSDAASGGAARRLLRDVVGVGVGAGVALRPVRDTEQPVTVSLRLGVRQIIRLDEREQVLTSYLWTRQEWTDELRHWNKSDYDGLDTIHVPSHYLWRPDIVLYNSVDGFLPPADTNVRLRHDGHLTWDCPAIVRSACPLDIRLFPFDSQRCPLTFGSWSHGEGVLRLRAGGLPGGGLEDLVQPAGWQVTGLTVSNGTSPAGRQPIARLTYTLSLRRLPAAPLRNLLLPPALTTALAPLTLCLPAPSGERVALGLALLLALTVFQLMLAETLPPAETAPLLGRFYIASMAIITTSTAMSVLLLAVYHRGPEVKAPPCWVRVVILGHLARVLAVRPPGEAQRRRAGSEVEAGLTGGRGPQSLGGDGGATGEEEWGGEEGGEWGGEMEGGVRKGEKEWGVGENGGEEGGPCLSPSLDPCSRDRDVCRGVRHICPHTCSHTCGHTCPHICSHTCPHICSHTCPHICPHSWQHLAGHVELMASCVRGCRARQQRRGEWQRVSVVLDRLLTGIFVLMVTVTILAALTATL